MAVLLSVLQSYDSESAAEGRRVFDSFRCMEETMGVAKKVRAELGATQPAASFLQDIAELLQVSQMKTARSTFGRANFAFKCQRWFVRLGAISRHELASALSHGYRCAQDWILTQYVGKWPFPITCDGRMRDCAAPGCPKCKRSVVVITRGITQLARRLLGADAPELAWLLRARHGADNSRAPHGVQQAVKTTARRLIRGSPSCEASRDYWPGTKALGRPIASLLSHKPSRRSSRRTKRRR